MVSIGFWIGIVSSIFLAGICEGVMDYLQFRYSKDNKFWNPKLSWVNKWKDGKRENGERFFLSSTILVFVTDGWHLMKWFRNRFINLLIFQISFISLGISASLIIVLVYIMLYGVGFMTTYKYGKKIIENN
jgi:hypothetical protein